MTETFRTLKPAKVTLLWRRYGDDIEWTATIDPPPFENYEALFGWQHEQAKERIPDPLYRAVFKLGEKVNNLSIFATSLEIVEQPAVRSRPKTGNLDETCGEIHEGGLDLEFYGACPVQGMGTLDGRVAYYRARGTGWSLEVWAEGVDIADDGLPEPESEWLFGDRDAYAFPDGGWLHRDVSITNLRAALAAWRARSAVSA